MKTIVIFGLAFAVALGAGAMFARAQSESDRNVVTITLLSEAVLDDSVVYLSQIAKITGGPLALRQRLTRLDVAEFKLGSESTAVSAEQVRFRLMLAGIGAGQYQLGGARRTIVTEGAEPVTARKILTVAERTMRSRNPSAGPPKEIIAPLLEVLSGERVELEVMPPRAGALRVDVAILVNGQMREVVPVMFEAGKAPSSKFDGVDRDIRPASFNPAKEKGEVLIKARDLVKVVAVVGSAQIVATGEAQQDGKLGEIIRVRNVESNRVVNARVEAAGLVLVEY